MNHNNNILLFENASNLMFYIQYFYIQYFMFNNY